MTQPTLRGDQVILRPWDEGDLDFVLSAAIDPDIPAISEVPARCDLTGAQAFIEAQADRIAAGKGWAWAVEADSETVGYVGALWISRPAGRASIGYWAGAANRRRGRTADAVATATRWLLSEGGVARLEAFIEPGNQGSIRVAESAGFTREGLMRSFAPMRGTRRDAYLFARIAGD